MCTTSGDAREHDKRVRRPPARLVLWIALLAAPGGPLSAAEPISPLLDRYAFTLGSYFTSTDTDLEVDERQTDRGDRFNFENELGFDSSDSLFRIGGQFLLGNRHQLNVSYYELNRDSSSVLQREITIGDRTFPIMANVEGFFDTSSLEISYTYWAVAREKVAFGINAGVDQLKFDAGVDLTLRAGAGIEPDISVDEFVPLIGAELRTAVARKLRFRAVGRYITASDLGDIERVDVFDFALGLEHQTFKHAGIGVVYRGFITDLDIDQRLVRGNLKYDIQGFEAFLRFWL